MKSLNRNQLKIGALLLFSCAIFFFSGCGSQQDESLPESLSEKTQYVLSLNNGATEDDKPRLAEQEMFKRLFRSHYPNLDVEFDTWQFTPETFIAKITAGTATDIMGVYATEGAIVIEKKLAAEITDLVKNWELYPYINKELLEPFTNEGKIYGVPVGGLGGAYVMTLFYNIDMFKEAGIVDENGEPTPPQTWEEFAQIAQQLTDQEKGVAGFGILGDSQASGWHFLNWVWQAGGSFEEKIDGKWQATFDSPEAIRALQFIKDLRWKYDVLQKDVTANNDDLFELFVSERIAMAIFTPEYLFYLVEKLQFPLEKIGICLLPAGPGGRANQMGGSFFIINPSIPKDKQEAAFKLITFHFNLDYIEAACKLRVEWDRLVGVPSLPVFVPEYQKKFDAVIDKYRNVPPLTALMAEAVKYMRPEPPFYCQVLYSEYLSPAIQKVLTDKDADPEKILTRAAKDFQERFLENMRF